MLAFGVQLHNRLSLIPGWAGFAAPKPELGVEHIEGPDGAPLFLHARRFIDGLAERPGQ